MVAVYSRHARHVRVLPPVAPIIVSCAIDGGDEPQCRAIVAEYLAAGVLQPKVDLPTRGGDDEEANEPPCRGDA